MSSPMISDPFLASIRPSVAEHKQRRRDLWSAEEQREYPDEEFFVWASDLLHDAAAAANAFVCHGTKKDMEAVLAFFMDGATAWPAHRRAFYGTLHTGAMRMEKEGLAAASPAFAAFMRERYTPAYTYVAERPAQPRRPMKKGPTPPPSPALPPILETSREGADE
jgi:hypothetical protein